MKRAVGASPWQVASARVTITVRNSTLSQATLLDAHGVPMAGDVLIEKPERNGPTH